MIGSPQLSGREIALLSRLALLEAIADKTAELFACYDLWIDGADGVVQELKALIKELESEPDDE